MMQMDEELRGLVGARARLQVAELDYRRALVRAARDHSQRELVGVLRLSHPIVSSALRTAEGVQMPREGASSASPYEVCQRYAAGLLSREDAIAELIAWPYVHADMRPAPGDDIVVIPPGTIDEVARASSNSLIDLAMYGEITRAVFGSD